MHIRKLLVCSLLALSFPALQAQSSFSAGNLIVYRVGNGTASLTSASAPIFLDEYSTSGTLIQSVPLASSGGNATSASGTAASEGQITLSSDGQYIAFSGYNVAPGNASVSGTTAAAVHRIVGTMSANGTLTYTSLGAMPFSANNPRGAYASDPSNIWSVGAGSGSNGVWYSNSTASTNLISGGLRAVNVFSGQLFIDSGSAIQSVGTNLPTTTGQSATTIVSTTGTTSAFFMLDLSNSIPGLDTLYVANGASNTTAIEKFTLTSGNITNGTWVASGTASIGSLGTAAVGAFGLIGSTDGSGNVTLYGSTSGASGTSGSLFFLDDNSGYGGTLAGTASLLASAPGNETFRGMAFTPFAAVPEPGTTGILIASGAVVAALGRRRRQA